MVRESGKSHWYPNYDSRRSQWIVSRNNAQNAVWIMPGKKYTDKKCYVERLVCRNIQLTREYFLNSIKQLMVTSGNKADLIENCRFG